MLIHNSDDREGYQDEHVHSDVFVYLHRWRDIGGHITASGRMQVGHEQVSCNIWVLCVLIDFLAMDISEYFGSVAACLCGKMKNGSKVRPWDSPRSRKQLFMMFKYTHILYL